MPSKKSTQSDRNYDARLARLERWATGQLPTSSAAFRRSMGGFAPNTAGLGDRSKQDRYGVIPMELRLIDEKDAKDAAKVLDPDAIKGKLAKKADYVGTYYGHRGVLRPEYDMLEPFTLVDTEAYLKQAIKRRLSLIMRNGYTVTSDKPQYSEYIQKRLYTMEYVTKRPINNLFRDMLFNLSLSSNCFLYKIRDEDGAGVTKKKDGKTPVAGYSIIPAHQIFPYLEKGVIKFWRRYYDTGHPYEDYPLTEIIHLHWDRKPGHIFGTPRTIAVRDDIFALRRLEENIELLLINHLFPLFHVKVGTEEAPSSYLDNGISEIDLIKQEIEQMPKEGVFVTDERVTVDAVGAEGKSLETKDIIAHLKSRVYTGLGVSPVDMGEGDSVNKSTADNISQVLKDALKDDTDHFAGQVRIHIFAELFQEANISLSVQGAVAETKLEFHEIDMDNRIKEENHTMEKFNNNMVNHDEARKQLKMKPMSKEEQKGMHHERISKDLITHEHKLSLEKDDNAAENEKSLQKGQIEVLKAQGELEKTKASTHTTKSNNQKAVLEHKAKHMPTIAKAQASIAKAKKSVSNKTRPANQHGKKMSPKRKSDLETVTTALYDKLLGAWDLWDKQDPVEWSRLSALAIDGCLLDLNEDEENYYTRKVREGSENLKKLVAGTTNPEMLYLLVHSSINEGQEDAGQQEPSDDVDPDAVSESTPGGSDPEPESGLEREPEGSDPDGHHAVE